MILPLALRSHAGSTPGAPAILEPGRTWTFAALDAHADALAAGLVAAGVQPGDRVALLAVPSASAIALLVAAGRVGACVAPLGTSLTAPELAAAGVVIGPRLAVHDAGHLDSARALGVPAIPLDALTADAVGARGPAISFDPDAPAVAILTSGTTGRPKAAILSHASMAASAAATVGFRGNCFFETARRTSTCAAVNTSVAGAVGAVRSRCRSRSRDQAIGSSMASALAR